MNNALLLIGGILLLLFLVIVICKFKFKMTWGETLDRLIDILIFWA